MKFGSLLLLLLILFFATPAAALSADFAPDRTAWKLTIRPEVMDNYVNFPSSQIGSVTRIVVYFETVDSDKAAKPVHFKNYYFHDGRPIGSRQITPVNFPPDTRGPIIVKAGAANSGKNTVAASANVTIRHFLDLYTSKNFPQFIIVDDAIFPEFIKAMQAEGFTPFNIPLSRDRPKPKAVMVLKSDKSDQFQYMMYQ